MRSALQKTMSYYGMFPCGSQFDLTVMIDRKANKLFVLERCGWYFATGLTDQFLVICKSS